MRNLIKKIFIGFMFLALFGLLFVPFSVNAENTNDGIPNGFMIDQNSDETSGNQHGLGDSIKYFSPVGQEFVPSHDKLVGVDVYVADFGGGSTELILRIHQDSMNGAVLASRNFAVETKYNGWKHIEFLPPVKLVPGSRYVIEIAQTDRTKNWAIVSDGRCWMDTYPAGGWILWGKPHDTPTCHNDLAFRTYTLKNTPK